MKYTLETTAGPANPAQLVSLAKGFSRIFWGIPLALLLYFDTISLNVFPLMRLPSYVVGILLIYWGMALLYRAGIVTNGWRLLVKLALICVFFLIYLAPFIYWGRKLPYNTYFAIHIFSLLVFTAGTLFLLSRITAELAGSLKDEWFRVESMICAWMVVILIVAPLLFYFTWSLQASLKHSTSLYAEIIQIHGGLPDYVQVFYLLPFTLTMAILWKAKERCFACLR